MKNQIEEIAEIERLRQWVADLQSGMYINCVYCGHHYGPKDEVPAAMADVLKQHIAVCPEHPMSKLLTVCKAMNDAIASLLYGDNTVLTEEFLERLHWEAQIVIEKAEG